MDKIKLLGLPFDFGQEHSGVRSAADYLKAKGLNALLSRITSLLELGNLPLPLKELEGEWIQIKHKKQCSVLNQLISRCIASLDLNSSFLLNIGGDHGLGLGSVHGMLKHNPDTIVVWADAHGDINTPESSPSGNFHGMPLSFLLGLVKDEDFNWISSFLHPKNLIFFGPRDLDFEELRIIKKLGIQYFCSKQINQVGAKEILEIALNRVDPFGTKPIHLSFDVDLFDRKDMKATGTRVCNGPRLEEVFLMGGILAETGRLRSMDVVEFNPLIGNQVEVEESASLILNFIENTLKQVFNSHSLLNAKSHPKDVYPLAAVWPVRSLLS